MKELTPQTPAVGILKQNDWGDSKWYYIQCDCGNEDCAHSVSIEADECDVAVHIYHTQRTKWWEKSRWLQIWKILTSGYVDMQTTIVLNEQTAINYSVTIQNAIKDVKEFRKRK